MKLTIKDIAKDLNLSKTTVSFVLSGIGSQKGISLATQAKVLSYAEEKHYQPNLLAKSLFSGVSQTIGVVFPAIGDMFYAELAMEIEYEAKKRGYLITICSSERDTQQEAKMIRMLRAKQVDGLIIAPTEHCIRELRVLKREKFPFVLVDRFFPDLDTNYVVIDDDKTAYGLTSNLIKDGYKKIALITIDTNVTAITIREEGYRRALHDAGIAYDEQLHCRIQRSDYAGDLVRHIEALMKSVGQVDAFFFTAHYLALETILYFYRNKIDVDAYGMACIHNNPIFETLAPNMKIARIPIETMGRQAVSILLDQIDGTSHGVMRNEILPIDQR